MKFSVSKVKHKDYKKSFEELRKEKLDRDINRRLDKESVNQKYMTGYFNYIKSSGDSLTSLNNKIKVLTYFFDFVKKDVEDLKRSDIEDFFANGWKKQHIIKYPNGKVIKREVKPWSIRTLNVYKVHLKLFFWWFYGCKTVGKEKVYPDVISWIVMKKAKSKIIDDILAKDEILKLMDNTICFRDKTIISMMYDAGVRVSELTNLKIKDVVFDEYGCKVKVSGKTGERKIRLIDSAPLIKQWINQHPFKNDRNKQLFICLRTRFGKPLVSSAIYKILEGCVKRSGIDKKVHPHLLRHTRLTHLASQGLNEMELRIFAGWTKSSNMPEIYLHISENDLDEKLISKSGMLSKKEQERIDKIKQIESQKLKPIICPQCQEVNVIGSQFCVKCGLILGVKGERLLEKKKKAQKEVLKLGYSFLEMSQNPEFIKMFSEFTQIFKVNKEGLSQDQLNKMEEGFDEDL